MADAVTHTMVLVGKTAAWTLALVGVWCATLTVVDGPELVAAVVCAIPCAVLATATRDLLGAELRPRAAWWRWLAVLPLAVLADSARLLVALVRAVARGEPLGRERTLVLPAADDEARARTRAALGSVVLSATPGAYVSDLDDVECRDARVLRLHALTARPSALERTVRDR